MKSQQEVFLRKLVRVYGYTAKDTYKEMAVKIGNICYGTVRNHLLALEEAKVLKIENKGKYHQTYHLNRNKVKTILND
jgi:Fe2+ or Zn2+ uptake regulation protein